MASTKLGNFGLMTPGAQPQGKWVEKREGMRVSRILAWKTSFKEGARGIGGVKGGHEAGGEGLLSSEGWVSLSRVRKYQ